MQCLEGAQPRSPVQARAGDAAHLLLGGGEHGGGLRRAGRWRRWAAARWAVERLARLVELLGDDLEVVAAGSDQRGGLGRGGRGGLRGRPPRSRTPTTPATARTARAAEPDDGVARRGSGGRAAEGVAMTRRLRFSSTSRLPG